MLKMGKKADGTKFEAAELTSIDLDTIKKMIEEQVPGAFTKKAKATSTKKAGTKTAKKTATKSAKKKVVKKK